MTQNDVAKADRRFGRVKQQRAQRSPRSEGLLAPKGRPVLPSLTPNGPVRTTPVGEGENAIRGAISVADDGSFSAGRVIRQVEKGVSSFARVETADEHSAGEGVHEQRARKRGRYSLRATHVSESLGAKEEAALGIKTAGASPRLELCR